MVKVVPLDPAVEGKNACFGFLLGQMPVPGDFDRMGEHEIARQFSGDE